MKEQGVKAGVSDIFLPVAKGGYFGLWVELKAPVVDGKKNYPTEAQAEWIQIMNEQGYKAVACWGWEQAKSVIEEYISQAKTNRRPADA